VTFLERADNATLDVEAEILGIPEAGLPRKTRSEMSLSIRFGGMGVEDLVALADAAHVGAHDWAVGSAIHFRTSQDARMRGDSHDEVSMEPTMYGRLAIAVTTEVSRKRGTPDGDDGDNEPMWSLGLASYWARFGAACGSICRALRTSLSKNVALSLSAVLFVFIFVPPVATKSNVGRITSFGYAHHLVLR
jgi:hypothetical protein